MMVVEEVENFIQAKKEERLNPSFNGWWSLSPSREYGRGLGGESLNPSFNGWWSLRLCNLADQGQPLKVLILLLMDDGRWDKHRALTFNEVKS